MSRLPLFLCLVALLGSTVSAALFFQIGNSKQLLEQRLADTASRAARLDTELAAVRERNGELRTKLGIAEHELASTSARLVAVEAKHAQLSAELGHARKDLADTKAVLGVYELTARSLAEDVATLRREIEEARASNASPEAVLAYKQTIADLERQLADARNGAVALAMPGGPTAVFSSRAGRATVLTVGPENAFVVLNFGAARGAQPGQKLTVSQGAMEIATVLISDVRTNVSIAQVLPDTLRGVLQKGDSAVLIR